MQLDTRGYPATDPNRPFFCVTDRARSHGFDIADRLPKSSNAKVRGLNGSGGDVRTCVEDWTMQALDALDAPDGTCYATGENGLCEATDELTGPAGVALAFLTLAGEISSDWMLLHGLRPL